jgi:hypothetical protein
MMAVLAALLLGCGSRPRAPVLRDDPVYQNDREGFRFLVPEGWKQHARTDAPPGKYPRDLLLVEYKHFAGGKGAMLQVSLADLPEATDLSTFLASPSFGVKEWKRAGSEEPLEVGGVSGVRLAFTGRLARQEMTREVVAFRRGERVYFFTGFFPRGDTEARDQIRRAVASTLWKK